MKKHYIFFSKDSLPQQGAHIVQIVHLANAAANLGYSSVLVYPKVVDFLNPLNLIYPFHPQYPKRELIEYYSLQEKLKIVELAIPSSLNKLNKKLTNVSTIACKYYLPFHLRHHAKIVHSRDWNFVKAAVKLGIPAIYERDHYENKHYQPEIVNNPFLQVTVTVAGTVRDNLIRNGMPPEKILTLHNGFNQTFYERHPAEAQEWRKKLLRDGQEFLIVYSGELARFKGIDLLIEVARQLPNIQFALAGGSESQIKYYQQMLQDKQVFNVTLVGYLPHYHLASLLQAANILVYPHLSGEAASFTSPMKLFDYIAAGKPIIATSIPTLKEFEASPVVTAWCQPDCSIQLLQAIQQVLLQYPQWTPENIHPPEFIQQFSWENRIQKTLEYGQKIRQTAVFY